MKVGKSKWFLLMLGVSVLVAAAENDVNKSEKPTQTANGDEKGNEN